MLVKGLWKGEDETGGIQKREVVCLFLFIFAYDELGTSFSRLFRSGFGSIPYIGVRSGC